MKEVGKLTVPAMKDFAYPRIHFQDLALPATPTLGFDIFERAITYLWEYDSVIFIGADSLVVGRHLPASPYDPSPPLIVSKDWWTDDGYFSMGNYILRNTPLMGTLIHEYFKAKGEHENEQNCMNAIVKQFPWLAAVLPHRRLNAVPSCVRESKAWQEAYRKNEKIRGLWEPGDFLMHFTGCDNESRVRLIKEVMAK